MNDFQFAARTLRKSPGFTSVTVLTLALAAALLAAYIPARRASGLDPSVALGWE